MINIDMTISQHGSLRHARTIRLCVADVRALPGTAVPAAGTKATVVTSDVQAPVCAATPHTMDVVLTGAFPGTSAWSPPI